MRVTPVVYVMIILVAALALSSCAQPAKMEKMEQMEAQSDIEIQSAWVRATPPNSKNSAAYMMLHNHTDQADRLLSAQSPIAHAAELHMVVKKDEMMSMQPVDSIPVPAQGSAMLKPGGYHIMLINLKQQPKAGEKVHLTLTFERAGGVMVMAPVQESGSTMMKHDHIKKKK
ncbi:MAG: copper chaperone PCu(A)C [Candidatus Tectomicrobia bacterium]|nr:copper chaperone PCu(A)C [Candidatus Tectomicrobia bacterium]